jgi:flagellar basal-body rod protein FlgG
MLYGIYQSAGGMQVNQYRMDVLANNIANMETAGFKQDLAVVRERLAETREGNHDPMLRHDVLDDLTGGSLVSPTYTVFEQGSIDVTGGKLDVAIDGDGFFRVQHPEGERYSRDGRFTINADGELVTVSGHHQVLDKGGSPIVVGTNAYGKASVDGDGKVRVGETVVGQLGFVDFEDKTLLRKTGGNLIQSMGAQPVEMQASLRTGAIERSNVDATTAMVQMIQVQRAYELNARMVGIADSTLGRAVNDIARIR